MPLVRIEILKGRTAPEKKRLLEAVHAALVEAFGIPDDDRTQRLVEHERDNSFCPRGW
jgi:phenylpyruvate tautomerase PptA (4-oxalocrotonate tautomerase family)